MTGGGEITGGGGVMEYVIRCNPDSARSLSLKGMNVEEEECLKVTLTSAINVLFSCHVYLSQPISQ